MAVSQSKVSLTRIEKGEKIAEMLAWYEKAVRGKNFAERVDRLWDRMAKSIKMAGYGTKDIERIIAADRAANR